MRISRQIKFKGTGIVFSLSTANKRHRGMALMLVIPAVALAAVLSYAVLTNVGTQDQISANAALLAQADCLAESGINDAMYELQQPFGSAFSASGVWQPPTTPTSLTSGTGTFLVTLSNTTFFPAGTSVNTATSYTTTITSTGSVIGSGGGTISRQIIATVVVPLLAVYPNQAVGINGNLTLGQGMAVASDLRSTGIVTLNSTSSVAGTLYAQSLVSGGGTNAVFVQETNSSIVSPTVVNHYQTYSIGGVTYPATRLTTNPAIGTTLGPTVGNPAGVYYSTGNLTLSGVTINGTLSVGSGLTISGATPSVINAQPNFPGLIVTSKITMSGAAAGMTVNGLAWAAQGITGAGTGNSLTFNGGLMIPNPTGVGIGTFNGSMRLQYGSQYAVVPGFSSQMVVPKSIQVTSWSQ